MRGTLTFGIFALTRQGATVDYGSKSLAIPGFAVDNYENFAHELPPLAAVAGGACADSGHAGTIQIQGKIFVANITSDFLSSKNSPCF